VELRQYLAVLWRRWPVIAVIVGLSLLFGAYTFLTAPRTYATSVSVVVRQNPNPPTAVFFDFNNYYNWLSNEFLSDDYTLIVSSRAFADRVAQQLQANPTKYSIDTSNVQPRDVEGTISADRKHRVLTLTVHTVGKANFTLSQAIANAAVDVLTAQSVPTATLPVLNGVPIEDNVRFGALDRAGTDNTSSSVNRGLIDAAIRVGLGVAAALALAFLLEYWDDRLRDEAEAERLLGVPVLAAIPRK
jgi:capsular polysaccharide biosynthesis protein